ncbi:MAG: 2-hydroxyacid dehydrogenase [Chitinophagales bacterium]|nr:2-hydroxyacid dehydrogenase [Chitinophagales bacterium]
MKTALYSNHNFEKNYLLNANNGKHELIILDTPLNLQTASLAEGCKAVALFVSDDASAPVLEKLNQLGVKFIALRSAGFNNVNIKRAKELGIKVARVPDYSPYAVAEHTIALMLALNRKIIRSHIRIMEQNFSLDGLVGFDMHGKTVGIIGIGKIGSVIAKILYGFGCKLLAFDKMENEELKEKYNVEYTDCMTLCKSSDIITLHAPLTEETKYIINKKCIAGMKAGVMLINTSRGALVNTKDVIDALKTGHIGYFGMDVYEEEAGLFFEDHSEDILQDDTIARLMSFKNVIITSHQAFLTDTALKNIAETTIYNLDCFEQNVVSKNELTQK